MISILDGIAVSIYGSILAASFSGALSTPKKHWGIGICTAAILILQGVVFFTWDAGILRQIYPFVTHLPLILLLWGLTGRLIWPVFSVFTAYLCCQLRRWLALFVLVLIPGDSVLLELVELILTLPLLFFLLRFMKPAIAQLSDLSVGFQVQFGIIPMLYYAFDYFSVVYTDLLSAGEPVVVEFMPFVCCAAYLVFLLYFSTQKQKQFQLHQAQQVLESQLNQSVREIDALRESHSLARQYRHDLRHHLQYLSGCLQSGQNQQALDYINSICRQIEQQTIETYCENEAANLILSAFVSRAQKIGVEMKIHGFLSATNKLCDSDLCVLLSNALENALHACQDLKDASIDVQFYEKGGQFFLQVTNPYEGEIQFRNGIPVSDRPDHGIGVQSICTIVQRYDGIYAFAAQNDRFILRISL